MIVDGDKVIVDVGALGVIGATLAGWLPNIAAILAIVWSLIRIYETQTVQNWLMKKAKAEARKEVVAEVVKALTPEDATPKSVAETVIEAIQPKTETKDGK